MKIIMAQHQPSGNINAFSGTSYFMTKSIKEQFESVSEYSSTESYELFKQTHEFGIRSVLEPIGRKFNSFLRTNNVQADFIIAQGGSSCIPFYNYDIPVVFWHDSSWQSFMHGYADADKFSTFRSVYPNFYQWDKAVMSKSSIVIYSSDYIAEACINHYNIPAEKVKVIPFGANLHTTPDPDKLIRALHKKLESPQVNLTFLGRDWKRKGLTIAIELVNSLNANNIPAVLNIIGCEPTIPGLDTNPFIRQHGILDKSNNVHNGKLESIMEESHFLVHPAISEPFGIALCEANAHGIPILATNVEGLRTIVRNGVNGYAFHAADYVAQSVDIIRGIMSDPREKYTPFFHQSLAEFNDRLNWHAAIRTLKEMLTNFKTKN